MLRKMFLIAVLALVVTAPLITEFSSVSASSHREAPLISQDPLADNTDLYAFVSPDRPDTVTIIANYIPMETPASGPGFFSQRREHGVVYRPTRKSVPEQREPR